jgi:hypothetical protein
MSLHELALVIDGVDFADDAVVDQLYAVLDDVTVGLRDGAQILYADREADTVAAAVAGVQADLRRALPEAFVVGIESECLVTQTGAAKLTGRTRQSLHQHVARHRGSGFLPALVWVDNNRPVWLASEVADWAGDPSATAHQIEATLGALVLARSSHSGAEMADAIDLAVRQLCAELPDDAHLIAERLRLLADGIEQPVGI